MFEPISRHDFGDFFASLDYYARDKAVLSSLKAQYPQLLEISRAIVESEQRAAALTPFPTIDEFTAVQCAVFDNWRGGGKTKDVRYVLTLEVWTASADRIATHKKANYQAKANIHLFDRKAMATKVGKLKGLPDEFVQSLRNNVVPSMGPNCLAGLLITKRPGEGTKIHPLYASVPGGICGESTTVILGDGPTGLGLPTFSMTQPDGVTRHSGNVILQSRADLSGFSVNWATPDRD